MAKTGKWTSGLPAPRPEPRIRGKTVYLLGAGFSAASGVPVLSQFLPNGLARLKDQKGADGRSLYQELILAIEQALYDHLPAAEFLTQRLANLEDIFCLVDLCKQSAKEGPDKRYFEQQETRLKEFVVSVLQCAWNTHVSHWERILDTESSIPVAPQQCLFSHATFAASPHLIDATFNVCAYQAFLSQVLVDNATKAKEVGARSILSLDDADAIITLNYDTVIEHKLSLLSRSAQVYYGPIALRSSAAQNVVVKWPTIVTGNIPPLPLLKIHGSINWQVSVDERTDPSSATHVDSLWEPFATNGNRDRLRRIAAIPIIPPTWRKSSSIVSVFGKLLGEALHHLRLAETIVIIGYSLPRTDAYFKYLFAQALATPFLPQIQLWDVVDPEQLRASIVTLLGDRVKDAVTVGSSKCRGFVEFVESRRQKGSF